MSPVCAVEFYEVDDYVLVPVVRVHTVRAFIDVKSCFDCASLTKNQA